MAGRTRYIKPDFFIDEKIAELTFPARIFFTGLWVHCDREGRLKESQKKLKAIIFPYDDVDIGKMLTELSKAGLIIRYEFEQESFIQVSNFKKHQKVHPQEPESTLPAPNDFNILKTPPTSSREVAHGLEYKYKYKGEYEGDEFEEFWKEYPKKKNRGTARKAWHKIKPTQELKTKILAALRRQKQHPDWLKDGGKFIPYPASWLNAEGWEDQLSIDNPTSPQIDRSRLVKPGGQYAKD